MDNNLLSTKFILTLLVLVSTFVLLVMDRVTSQLWEEIALIALGVYTAGNVVAGAVYSKSKETTPVK